MIILLMRLSILFIALAVCFATVRGAWAISCGRFDMLTKIRSAIFFLCLAPIVFQLQYFITGVPVLAIPSRVFGMTVQLIGVIMAAWVVWRLRPYKRLSGVFDHLDFALAITDLARLDPEEAERLSTSARKATAKALYDA